MGDEEDAWYSIEDFTGQYAILTVIHEIIAKSEGGWFTPRQGAVLRQL